MYDLCRPVVWWQPKPVGSFILVLLALEYLLKINKQTNKKQKTKKPPKTQILGEINVYWAPPCVKHYLVLIAIVR